jgi:uncharacterized protein (TIGR04141 family)
LDAGEQQLAERLGLEADGAVADGLATLDQISVYLLADDLGYRDALRDPDKLQDHRLKATGLDGMLFLATPVVSPPSWIRFVRELTGAQIDYDGNRHISGVLFLKRQGKTFALTFGYGRHLLKPEVVVADYGLKVAAGLINPQEISSLDSRAFEATVLQVRRQSNRGTGPAAIGFDVGREMLRALAGQLKDKSVGTRITGSDSVGLAAKMDAAAIGEKVDRLYDAYEKGLYQDNAFKHIDRWSRLKAKDNDARDLDVELESELTSRRNTLKLGLTQGMSPEAFGSQAGLPTLAAPEVIEYRSSGFRTDVEDSSALHPFPDLDAFLLATRSDPSIASLKRHRLVVVAADANESAHDWPLYNSLTWERELRGTTYMLAEGAWWRIAPEYRNLVNELVMAIPTSTLARPAFDPREWEGDYNKRLADADPKRRALLDRKNAKFEHESGTVEPCDVLTADGEFVHVKCAWQGSEAMSHLFAQGWVAARLFVRMPEFRSHIRGLLPTTGELAAVSPPERPDPRTYRVVFGIVSYSDNANAKSLPFFARNLLSQVAQQIEELGYRVELLWIPVQTGARPAELGPTSKEVDAARKQAEAAAVTAVAAP